MILPIYIYGHPVLRKQTVDMNLDKHPDLKELIANMFETMYQAEGIGLAGPQVGLEERIFVVDLSPLANEEHPEFRDCKKVFINANITERGGDMVVIEEGCLSIPGIHEKVARDDEVHIEYLNQHLELCQETYRGYMARVIQHEYDHLNGVLFVDKISPLRKRMIRGKLSNMERGNVACDYRIKTVR